MQFRILGPLEVHADGGELVRLGAAKQRVLLLALLLHANRLVSTDRLMATVWPGQPPKSAPGNLRTYVSVLRQLLGLEDRGGLPRLTAQPGGYRLDVPPSDLDLLVFDDLAARGGQALASGDHAGAALLLGEALRLWRGRAAQDSAAGGDVAATLAGLEERRLAAEEAWADARLALGDGVQLIARLKALAADHPLREKLWGQLIEALYRAGRRAEALAAFQELRRRVAHELGLEPGLELQRLQQRILAGEAPTARAARPGRPAGVRVPVAQLPPDITRFTGRAAPLRQLGQLLAAHDERSPRGPAIITITGMAGVGKTALAVHWAHQVAERFGDGQLHADLQGFAAAAPAGPASVLARFLRALGVPGDQVPAGLDDAAVMYRSLLAGKRVLVLLDNAATSAQVRPLLPGSPGSLVLVTSRGNLGGLAVRDDADRVMLPPLAGSEAISLLRAAVGPARVEAEPAGAAELATRCAGLPLALRIAADRAAVRPHLSLHGLATQLAATRDRLDLLATEDDTGTALRSVFSWSYRALPDDTARMFRLLGLHPGPDISIPAAAALAATGMAVTARLLDELAAAHLLEETMPGRYRFHDLLRVYAADRAAAQESDGDRECAQQRVLAWYLNGAWTAREVLVPARPRVFPGYPSGHGDPPVFTSHDQALAWCDAEQANLSAAVHLAAGTRHDDMAWKLAAILWEYFYLRKAWADWISTQQAGLASARRIGNLHAEAEMLNQLSGAYGCLGRYTEAVRCAESALTLYRLTGDQHSESVCLANLGIDYLALGQADRAFECNQQALSVSRGTGDLIWQGAALHGLGHVYHVRGRLRLAVTCFTQSLGMFRATGERQGEHRALTSLGMTYLDLGEPEKALRPARRAAAICREIGDRHGEAKALRTAGDALHGIHQEQAAGQSWRQALAIFEDLADTRAAAEIRGRLLLHPGPGHCYGRHT